MEVRPAGHGGVGMVVGGEPLSSWLPTCQTADPLLQPALPSRHHHHHLKDSKRGRSGSTRCFTSLIKPPLPAAGNLLRGLVSCTGSQFCPLGLVETKNRALQVRACMAGCLIA